ncbi:hypothetical protein BGX31_010638 [Mortierella sp. GBA43]|nr:hypothetical protein BGX31_010638 [Mortierella sp. GBA43]
MNSFFQDPRGHNARRRGNSGLSDADDSMGPSKQRQQRQRQWHQQQLQQQRELEEQRELEFEQHQRDLEQQQQQREQELQQREYELERQRQLLLEQEQAEEEVHRRAASEGRVQGRQHNRQNPSRKERHEHPEMSRAASQALNREQRQHHAPQQHHQPQPSHSQQQQWRPGQQSHTSKRHGGRRQRRHGPRELVEETPSDQVHPSTDETPNAASRDETKAEIHSVPVKTRPSTLHQQRSSESSMSDQPEEHDQDQDEDEDEETVPSEDEELPMDRELQQKSQAELEQIESSLAELSQELDQILAGQITHKKQILLTEENLTKAMLKIDAVESGGDDSIRKRRKGLINQAEQLLVKVDEFKRKTNTNAYSSNH